MKNWKTTLAGLVLGLPGLIDALIEAYVAGYFTGKYGWQLAGSLAIIVLGFVLKDKKPTVAAKGGGAGTPNKPL